MVEVRRKELNHARQQRDANFAKHQKNEENEKSKRSIAAQQRVSRDGIRRLIRQMQLQISSRMNDVAEQQILAVFDQDAQDVDSNAATVIVQSCIQQTTDELNRLQAAVQVHVSSAIRDEQKRVLQTSKQTKQAFARTQQHCEDVVVHAETQIFFAEKRLVDAQAALAANGSVGDDSDDSDEDYVHSCHAPTAVLHAFELCA